MAITWYWNHIIGRMKYKSEIKGWRPFYKRILGGGNCLAVLANYESPSPSNDLKKKGWCVYGEFWNDTEHLQRCLGLRKAKWLKKPMENIYYNVEEVKLNTYYEEWQKIAKNFAKAGIRVVLFYQEPKEKKK